MSRTVRNKLGTTRSNAHGAGVRHWEWVGGRQVVDVSRRMRDGRDVGTTRLRAQRKAKTILQKKDRMSRKEEFHQILDREL